MNKNSIKDEELENVNGGTWKETAELSYTLQRPNAEIVTLKNILKAHEIEARLNNTQHKKNSYRNIETDEKISHDGLIKMIEENRWHK
ncbi:MAG: hypothetical protein IJI66_08890 [Erysipelotrichaceae bacterium]|nr:hypothetical protein [Erysipelotrichaceae bacterium]